MELGIDDPTKAAYGEKMGALLYLSTHAHEARSGIPSGCAEVIHGKADGRAFSLVAVKRILRYLRGMWNYGLMFRLNPEETMRGASQTLRLVNSQKLTARSCSKELVVSIGRDEALQLCSCADLAGDHDNRKSMYMYIRYDVDD